MYQANGWEKLSMQLLFRIFDKSGMVGSSYAKEKEDYNPLDYFRIGIIEEIKFLFSSTANDQPLDKKLCTGMMQK